ncbi:unnamed protein product [Calypogeia fissa]
MGDWKAQAPAALVVPSYVDGNDLKRTQSVGRSPFSSGGGVQPFPILNPESLLSPHDPGFLDGASSLARFGLDIGGTLCKVVYFEPAVNFTKDSSRPWKQPKCAGYNDGVANGKLVKDVAKPGDRIDVNWDSQQARGGFSAESFRNSPDKERNGCTGNGIDIDREASSIVRVIDGNAEELMTPDVESLVITDKVTSPTVHIAANGVHVDGAHGVENGKGTGANGKTTEAVVLENCQCGGDKPAVQVLDQVNDDRSSGAAGSSEDEQDSRKKAKKIWVSSHEPVHLPGRGTLYFKCFETWRMEEFLSLTKEYNLMTKGRAIGATGGGTRKFGDRFLEIAGLQLERADELKSLVKGIDFLARHAQQESFEYSTESYQGGSIQRPWQSPENSSDESSDSCSEEEFSLNPCREELGSEIASPAQQTTPVNVASAERHEKAQTANTPTLKGPLLARLDSGFCGRSHEPLHPYLVVNIGSGVSMLRVDSTDKFERVGGTSLGGSTFLGLANALTGCQSFEEAISLATQGDSTHVDMLVGDIYGGDYTEMGLAATTVASSFGKVASLLQKVDYGTVRTEEKEDEENLVLPQRRTESQDPQHLAKAALLMVTNNIGSIAMLHARNAGVRSIMFTGSFLHNNKLAMRLLAVAMEFWSEGNMKAVFLRHEGHAGAMGALLSALESSNPLDSLLLT